MDRAASLSGETAATSSLSSLPLRQDGEGQPDRPGVRDELVDVLVDGLGSLPRETLADPVGARKRYSPEEYVMRRMIQEIVDAGCRYVQIDAPGFTAYVDETSLGRMRARGEDPKKNLRRAIEAENAVIEGFDGVTFGLHICRGNPRGTDASGKVQPQWHREGHYDSIAEQLFTGLNHDRLLLEYDSERAGSFSALRFVRKGTIAVLGIVTSKSEELEHGDFLKRRLDDAFRYIPRAQVAISPQCGFSSGVGEIQMDENAQWRKFERLLEVARDVWR